MIGGYQRPCASGALLTKMLADDQRRAALCKARQKRPHHGIQRAKPSSSRRASLSIRDVMIAAQRRIAPDALKSAPFIPHGKFPSASGGLDKAS